MHGKNFSIGLPHSRQRAFVLRRMLFISEDQSVGVLATVPSHAEAKPADHQGCVSRCDPNKPCGRNETSTVIMTIATTTWSELPMKPT
jgi:hypothetical protein